MTVSVYAEIKKQIACTVGTSEKYKYLIGTIKHMFKEDINSARRFETIKTITDLYEILELRDTLSPDNVGPLKRIAENLNDSELSRKIVEYEQSYVKQDHLNYYDHQTQQNSAVQQLPQQLSPGSYISTDIFGTQMSYKKRQRIHNVIVEEIGTHWRDLARCLKIREGIIDEIDNKNSTIASKAMEIIQFYEERADPQRWFFALCEALEKARRKDLRQSIEQIMSMNI